MMQLNFMWMRCGRRLNFMFFTAHLCSFWCLFMGYDQKLAKHIASVHFKMVENTDKHTALSSVNKLTASTVTVSLSKGSKIDWY